MGFIVDFLLMFIQLYNLIVLGRVLLSWFPNVDYHNPLVRLLVDLTEPVLRPIRNALPPMNGVDFSPMALILGLFVISSLLRAL